MNANIDMIAAIQGGQAGSLAVTLICAELGAALEYLRGVDGSSRLPFEHQERMVAEWGQIRDGITEYGKLAAAKVLADWHSDERDQMAKAIAVCLAAQVNLHATARACGKPVPDVAAMVSAGTGAFVKDLKLDQRGGGK